MYSHRVFNNQPGQNATVSREASIVAFKRISHPPATAMTIAELLGFDMSLLWKRLRCCWYPGPTGSTAPGLQEKFEGTNENQEMPPAKTAGQR